MVRKLAPVLALLVVLLPGMVKALGLGDIQLDSYLNQPLKAEIELISVTQGEVDGMRVKLASPAEFATAGIEYLPSLRNLKFKVIRRNNGKHYIQVTTPDNFREPFLNFLLEVNWAKGRILREYTLLIDPPTLVKSTPPAASTTTTRPGTSAAPTVSSAPKTPKSGGDLYGGPSAPADTTKAGVIGSQYRTQRNDTTWRIAQRILPDGNVSMEQAMLALVRSNPQAFMGQNINRLKAGYLIKIPGRDEMTSISKAEALALVRQQNRAWREGRSVATTTKPAAPQAPAGKTGKGKLEILPPQMAGKSTSGGQTGGAPGSDAASMHRQVMMQKETIEAQKQENTEMRMRISELEAQIKNQKRLATMKDDQLAALQKKLAELQAQMAKTAAAPTTAGTPPVQAEAKPEPEAKPTEEKPPVTEHKPVVDAKPATPGAPVNQHAVKGFKPVDINKLPKTPVPAKPFKEEPATAVKPKPATAAAKPKKTEEGTFDSIIRITKDYFNNEPLTAWLVVAAVVLIVLLLIVVLVQKRKGRDRFDESILQDQQPDSSTATAAVAGAAAGVAAAAAVSAATTAEEEEEAAQNEAPEEDDSALVSDFVLSDMSDLQEGGEADPLTEADVFLAYGRFGPAENMIKEAIEGAPERNDLRLKLLEIYYAAKNSDAFQSEAESFKQHLESHPDDESWAKVVEMAEDLVPGSSILQAGAVEEAPAETTESTETAESTESAGMEEALADMEGFDLEAELEETASGSDEDTTALDFDLGEFEEQLDKIDTETESEDTMDELGELDLDLDLDAISEEEQPVEESAAEENVVEDVANELESLTEDTMLVDTTASSPEGDTQAMQKEEASEEQAPPSEEDLDLSALDQPDDSILDAGVESDLADMDLDDEALGELDEVGTKLDLAKAYIDMGDPEGARSILTEVLEEGNDEQKSEADGLMKQIS